MLGSTTLIWRYIMKDEDIKLFMMNSGEIIVAEIVDYGVEQNE